MGGSGGGPSTSSFQLLSPAPNPRKARELHNAQHALRTRRAAVSSPEVPRPPPRCPTPEDPPPPPPPPDPLPLPRPRPAAPNPRLTHALSLAVAAAGTKEVLERLDPTARTMLAQVGRPWLVAVLASGLSRVPKAVRVRLRLKKFCTSGERLAWAKANFSRPPQPWVPVELVAGVMVRR